MSILTSDFGHHGTTVVKTQVERVISTLKWTFGLVPIVAGADKFSHVLTNWDKYLSPIVPRITGLAPHTFMSIVGVIEIVAGIIVLAKPRIGSLIVSLWLIGIAANLVTTGDYYDVAVRDTVMAISAFCLYLLCHHGREA
jgi:uncharacterized membrane protein YphA (DoxX/SURF4 family)